ncbi:uncharacterized protein LOC135482045 [Liolophura sinensis]|uniref:uncharacterized protein LOC135482045 n=1 Tax=Liolophura sinensis TaxID=3198878 RepID=UPI0031594F1A
MRSAFFRPKMPGPDIRRFFITNEGRHRFLDCMMYRYFGLDTPFISWCVPDQQGGSAQHILYVHEDQIYPDQEGLSKRMWNSLRGSSIYSTHLHFSTQMSPGARATNLPSVCRWPWNLPGLDTKLLIKILIPFSSLSNTRG